MFGVTTMITLVFIVCRLVKLLQNFSRNPSRLSKVRVSNGIKVLLSLLMVKTPLVDADCIRALTCKALCGLSRSEKIRQVIGKLQLFNSGQLQSEYYTARCFFHARPIMYIIQLGVPPGKMKLVLCSDSLPELLLAWDITLLSRVR